MNYNATHGDELHPLRFDRQRAIELLGRYPGISKANVQELLRFLKRGRHLDIGAVTSDETLRPNLDAFMADHKSHFQVRFWEGAAFIGGTIALLTLAWLVWELFQ